VSRGEGLTIKRVRRIFLLLFGYYLLAVAVFTSLSLVFFGGPATSSLFVVLIIAPTYYMALSVFEYRRRILKGERYPKSLRVFKVFYWTGTILLFLLLFVIPQPALTQVVNRILFLVVLSYLYSPVDLLSRLYVFSKRRRAKKGLTARRPEPHR
jgi:hypothetical protein